MADDKLQHDPEEWPEEELYLSAEMREAERVTDLGHIESVKVPPTNDMALVSFLGGVGGWILAALGICPLLQGFNLCIAPLAFVAWTTALITGFVARDQLADGKEGGEDLAVWGMATGGVGIVLGSAVVLLVVLLLILGINFAGF